MISQLRKTFKKKKLVLLYLDLVKAKTYLLEKNLEECYETLLDTQKKLEKERKIPKQILCLLNEVWASYQWQRENYQRCHQSLLSFLVYSDLNRLSPKEQEQVIYRLIVCKIYFILFNLIKSFISYSKSIKFFCIIKTRYYTKI